MNTEIEMNTSAEAKDRSNRLCVYACAFPPLPHVLFSTFLGSFRSFLGVSLQFIDEKVIHFPTVFLLEAQFTQSGTVISRGSEIGTRLFRYEAETPLRVGDQGLRSRRIPGTPATCASHTRCNKNNRIGWSV